jgi:hypothetical protein
MEFSVFYKLFDHNVLTYKILVFLAYEFKLFFFDKLSFSSTLWKPIFDFEPIIKLTIYLCLLATN